MGCCVTFLVTSSLNGMVVLVAAIAENPRLPKPVRLDSTTHMRVHMSSCTTCYIHAYYLHYLIFTCLTCMLTFLILLAHIFRVDAPLVVPAACRGYTNTHQLVYVLSTKINHVQQPDSKVENV